MSGITVATVRPEDRKRTPSASRQETPREVFWRCIYIRARSFPTPQPRNGTLHLLVSLEILGATLSEADHLGQAVPQRALPNQCLASRPPSRSWLGQAAKSISLDCVAI